ncbi:hypothetical protein [Paraburkholderia lycopersici]|uniref:Uncharacterized protein n=1 Tax=Paraburkholderia lycopersici TaxID=416944 RepID=A0A1G6ZDK7_9BURK|nr:hypothetical protein [Paraburkholderia lycopersici]SDE00680.1 hypothetical protein SAMN05421548_13042 [Paraburkholderia lycopersici]
MSTFPFVQIEGALALPHIRPLVRLPVSFGREWTLTPAHASLRAELHALYAAILRTVCLSAEAFRAAARWDRNHSPAPQPRTPVAAAVFEPENTGGSPASRTAEAGMPAMSSYGAPAFERRKLAGGAVAIGGAALLAWIVASHTPHDTAIDMTGTAQQPAAAEASEPPPAPALPGTAGTRSAEASASRPANKPDQATAPSPARIPATPAIDERSWTQTNDPVRAQPHLGVRMEPKAGLPARLVQREMRAGESAVNRGAGQRVAERSASTRHDAQEFAPSRDASRVTVPRSHGGYSETRGYSPRQTGAIGADEYASIFSYAKTYAPAPTFNRPAIPADSTDWVNHVSQRRITEVPERFTK